MGLYRYIHVHNTVGATLYDTLHKNVRDDLLDVYYVVCMRFRRGQQISNACTHAHTYTLDLVKASVELKRL